MVGTTLTDIRDHIETLACAEGPYAVHCARTGEHPIPTAGKRFETRALAQRAATAATQYRAALRRYDPRLPHYDLVVTQAIESGRRERRTTRGAECGSETTTLNDSGESAPPTASAPLVEFCHCLAASVFESLCQCGHRDVETAVMDVYLDLAETVEDPDELCLCLLESMAVELDRRLAPAAAADVLAGAAARLPSVDSTLGSVPATLETLDRCGLLSDYTYRPGTGGPDDTSQSTVVRIAGYALSPRDGRLPVLPIVVGLYAHSPDRPLAALRAVDDDDCWELTLARPRPGGSSGVASVPVEWSLR